MSQDVVRTHVDSFRSCSGVHPQICEVRAAEERNKTGHVHSSEAERGRRVLFQHSNNILYLYNYSPTYTDQHQQCLQKVMCLSFKHEHFFHPMMIRLRHSSKQECQVTSIMWGVKMFSTVDRCCCCSFCWTVPDLPTWITQRAPRPPASANRKLASVVVSLHWSDSQRGWRHVLNSIRILISTACYLRFPG